MDPTHLPTRLPQNVLPRWQHICDPEDRGATALAQELKLNRAQLSRVLNGHGADIVALFFGGAPNESGQTLLGYLGLTWLQLSERLYAWLALDSRRIIEPAQLAVLDPPVCVRMCSSPDALGGAMYAEGSWHPLSGVLEQCARWVADAPASRHVEVRFASSAASRLLEPLTMTFARERVVQHALGASASDERVRLELSPGTAQEMLEGWADTLHEEFILNTERHERLQRALARPEIVSFLDELSAWVSEPARCREVFCRLFEALACGMINLEEPHALHIRLEELLRLELERALAADTTGDGEARMDDEDRALVLRWVHRETPRFFQCYLREAGSLAAPLDAMQLIELVRGPRTTDSSNADRDMLAEQVLASAALFGQDSQASNRALDAFANLFNGNLLTALRRTRWFIEEGSSYKLSSALVDLGRLHILRTLSEQPDRSWLEQSALWRREPYLMMHVIRRSSVEALLGWVAGIERMTPARWRLDARLALLDALAWRNDHAALLDTHEPLRTLWARTLLAWAEREASNTSGASDERRLYEAIRQFSSQRWGVVLLEVGARINPEHMPLDAREAGPLDSLVMMCGLHNPHTPPHKDATELLIWLAAMHLWPGWGGVSETLIEAMRSPQLAVRELREAVEMWRGALLAHAQRGDVQTASLILTAVFHEDWELHATAQLELLQHASWPPHMPAAEIEAAALDKFAERLIADALIRHLDTDARDDQVCTVLRAVLERRGELVLVQRLRSCVDELVSPAGVSAQTLGGVLSQQPVLQQLFSRGAASDDHRPDQDDRLIVAYALVMKRVDALRALARLDEQPDAQRFDRAVLVLMRAASYALGLAGAWEEALALLSRDTLFAQNHEQREQFRRLGRLAPPQHLCAHMGWDKPELDETSRVALRALSGDQDMLDHLWPGLEAAARRLALETITAVGPDDQQWWTRAQRLLSPVAQLDFARRHNADTHELMRAARLVLDDMPNAAAWWEYYLWLRAAERPTDTPTLSRQLNALDLLAGDDGGDATQPMARHLCGVLIGTQFELLGLEPEQREPLLQKHVRSFVLHGARACASEADARDTRARIRTQLIRLWSAAHEVFERKAREARAPDAQQARDDRRSLWQQFWNILDQSSLSDILEGLGWSSRQAPVPPREPSAQHLTQPWPQPEDGKKPTPGCVDLALTFNRRMPEDEPLTKWRERIGAAIRSAPDTQREAWLADLDNASRSSCDAETFAWIVGLIEALST